MGAAVGILVMLGRSNLRSGLAYPESVVHLLCVAALCFATPKLLGLSPAAQSSKPSARTLTFEQRVTYQRAIEEVYWSHRIWPKESHTAKPPLDRVMSGAQIENKVKSYLRNSDAVEGNRHQPIIEAQLQAEMDRMAQHTK